MKNLAICVAAVLTLAPLADVAATQEPCAVRPLTAADLKSGPTALNEALLCLERRIQALEQRSGGAAEGQADPFAPLAETTILGMIKIGLDYASVVDGKQLLLEYSITNEGEEPVLAIIAAFQDSSVSLRGEAKPRPFRVQGLATCPTYQARVTQNCIERAADAEWTLLQPGSTYPFEISTDARHGEIKSDAAAASIRLIIRKGEDTQSQDVSFGRIPLEK